MTPDVTPIADLDTFFLSYDEPNAELNWSHLLSTAPWARRVHGITGFDAAHKECARLSRTERFITVDADNRVDPRFFDGVLKVRDADPGKVLSWRARNVVNGLSYGNGGVKIWPRGRVLSMMTHESAEDEESQVDFCWALDYQQMGTVMSEVHINASPYQAWRAGFREGVKMSLDRGKKVSGRSLTTAIPPVNLQRLLVWCTIGMDVRHGEMAMLGARIGCFLTNTDWDHHLVRDYAWMKDFYDNDASIGCGLDPVTESLGWYGDRLRKELGLHIADMNADCSRFFKSVYPYPSGRLMDPEQ